MAAAMKLLPICCVLLVSVPQCCPASQLWAKVREFFREKQPLPREGEFMRDNEFEFPGTNRRVIEALAVLWDQHYDCLRRAYQALGPQRSIMPEAIMVFEGSSVKLPSKACISPAYEPLEARWLYQGYEGGGARLVELGEDTLMSPEDRTLTLYNVRAGSSGQYLCKTGPTVTASYFLHVVDHTEKTIMNDRERNVRTTQVYSDTARANMTRSQPPAEVPQWGLRVFTKWQPWSGCSRCGVAGKRVATGACTVSLSGNRSRAPATDILQLFPAGVPCRSPLLPSLVRGLPAVQGRPSEIMTGYCKVPCQGAVVYEVRDRHGHLVESANNSAGIYSVFQGVPTPPPAVQRKSQYETTSTATIIIQCPGNTRSDTPVLWQAGGRYINPLIIMEQTRGRIYIDPFRRIFINNPQVKDSNIYSCWQSRDLVGTVRLIVEQKSEFTLNHRTTLIGLAVILGTMAYVLYRAVVGRGRR